MASVTGFDPAQSGQEPVNFQGDKIPVGVWGDSTTGVGVFGTSGDPMPDAVTYIRQTAGVYGQGTQGPGADDFIYGPIPGVIGVSPAGVGVAGLSDDFLGLYAATDTTDVYTPAIFAVAGNNVGMGVQASAASGEGVVGSSITGTGVHGTAGEGTGVLGESFGLGRFGKESGVARYGVYGASDNGTGVHGVSSAAVGTEGFTFGDGYGVYGVHFSTDPGSGVFGESVLGNGIEGYSFSQDPDAAAVRGENVHGYAGLFVGDVKVTGALSKPGGGFRVDHPQDPENKYLSHSFVESPDMMNVYSGTVTTDDHGNARVALPDYFEALNRDVRYQLTAVGQFARVMVSEEINRNEFAISSDVPNVKVCWQVTGVRQDAWAEAHRIPVEEDKPPAEKGRYLHPELFDHNDAIHRFGRRPAAAVAAALPEHLRPRAERVLSAPPATGATEAPDVTELVSEIRGWMAQSASDSQAHLREQRQRGVQILERLRPRTSRNRD
jgi:hypothetical protein